MKTDDNADLARQATLQREMTRYLAVGSVLGLIVLSLAWELFLAPLRPGGSWLALKALPLCLPLAGLLKNKMYTYRWVSLMVWLYFAEGAVRAYSDRVPSNYYAMLQVLLCCTLFTACALHVRLRLKAGAQAAGAAGAATTDTTSASTNTADAPRS
jgi:uncharacterized membrane protein